jgi:hypothetical protein
LDLSKKEHDALYPCLRDADLCKNNRPIYVHFGSHLKANLVLQLDVLLFQLGHCGVCITWFEPTYGAVFAFPALSRSTRLMRYIAFEGSHAEIAGRPRGTAPFWHIADINRGLILLLQPLVELVGFANSAPRVLSAEGSSLIGSSSFRKAPPVMVAVHVPHTLPLYSQVALTIACAL